MVKTVYHMYDPDTNKNQKPIVEKLKTLNFSIRNIINKIEDQRPNFFEIPGRRSIKLSNNVTD